MGDTKKPPVKAKPRPKPPARDTSWPTRPAFWRDVVVKGERKP